MKTISLHGSQVLVGERLAQLPQYLKPYQHVVVITEECIYKHYSSYLQGYSTIIIPGGEPHKTLQTVADITSQLIGYGADRNTFILGFGGGIVCDITGFVASIFMRGCRFGFVSTTVLSQVDASVGGKNGVNFEGFKNMLGVFNQPEFVLCDLEVFATLEKRHFVAGFAEIVKAAMIIQPALFDYIEQHVPQALALDHQVMQHLVYESVQIKADIVSQDERERGERRKLNLGHTFAHAIEKNSSIYHGEAVSIGLCMASKVSVSLGQMTTAEYDRVEAVLRALGLPVSIDVPMEVLFQSMYKDKKKAGDSIHLILPIGIGRCEVRQMSFAELEQLTRKM